jgi:Fe-S cluster biogenesis protein NfuA
MVIEDKDLLLKRIDIALNDVRPFLQVDGGNVEVVDVTDDMTVQIKWLGMCENCSMSAMTMKAGIEQAIKSRMPEIKSVVALNGMGLVV